MVTVLASWMQQPCRRGGPTCHAPALPGVALRANPLAFLSFVSFCQANLEPKSLVLHLPLDFPVSCCSSGDIEPCFVTEWKPCMPGIWVLNHPGNPPHPSLPHHSHPSPIPTSVGPCCLGPTNLSDGRDTLCVLVCQSG